YPGIAFYREEIAELVRLQKLLEEPSLEVCSAVALLGVIRALSDLALKLNKNSGINPVSGSYSPYATVGIMIACCLERAETGYLKINKEKTRQFLSQYSEYLKSITKQV